MAPTICLPELSANNNNKNNNDRAISSYTRHRQRNVMRNGNVIIKEQQRRRRSIEIERIFNNPTPNQDHVASLTPPASPVWEPTCPITNSFLHERNSISNSADNIAESTAGTVNLNCSQRWRSILARREGLLDIVARTMALVRRSHLLQKRVNALRYETREFIRSVLNNPENNNGGKMQLMDMKSRGMLTVRPCYGYNAQDTMEVSSPTYSSSSSSSSFSTDLLSSRPITPPPTPDSSTEYIINIDDHINDDNDYTTYSNSSENSDYSSDDNTESSNPDIKVDQDPMVSSS